MYKLTDNGVIRKEDGANIPENINNSDWVTYLKWIEEGNEVEKQYLPEEKREYLRSEVRAIGLARVNAPIENIKGLINIDEGLRLRLQFYLVNFDVLKDAQTGLLLWADCKFNLFEHTLEELKEIVALYDKGNKDTMEKCKKLLEQIDIDNPQFFVDIIEIWNQ